MGKATATVNSEEKGDLDLLTCGNEECNATGVEVRTGLEKQPQGPHD